MLHEDARVGPTPIAVNDPNLPGRSWMRLYEQRLEQSLVGLDLSL